MMPWIANYIWENLTTVGKIIAEIWYVLAIHKCPPMKVDPLPRLRHNYLYCLQGVGCKISHALLCR